MEDDSEGTCGEKQLVHRKVLGVSKSPSSKRNYSQPTTKKCNFNIIEKGNRKVFEAEKENTFNEDL